MITQDDYTSRRIHNKLGFGFAVCLSCCSKEPRDQRVAYTKFEEGLRQRLGLVCSALRLKSISVPDAEDIQISFSRSLPVNEMEVAQMVRTLSDLVPEEVLLSQVPFIKDVKLALDMLDQERGTETEPALEEV